MESGREKEAPLEGPRCIKGGPLTLGCVLGFIFAGSGELFWTRLFAAALFTVSIAFLAKSFLLRSLRYFGNTRSGRFEAVDNELSRGKRSKSRVLHNSKNKRSSLKVSCLYLHRMKSRKRASGPMGRATWPKEIGGPTDKRDSLDHKLQGSYVVYSGHALRPSAQVERMPGQRCGVA